jgi:SsrA-binding protein
VATDNPGTKLLANNRKARFNYEVDETLECGIELKGTEVKSMKSAQFSFTDAYGRIKDGELWLVSFHITPYTHGNIFNHDPDRERKLLIHKLELKRMQRKVEERGFTLIPLKFYLKRGIVKLELGICRGKKAFDKRNTIKDREQKREIEREIRQRL